MSKAKQFPRLLIAMAMCLSLVFALTGMSAAIADDGDPIPTSVISWDGQRQHIDGFGGSYSFHKAGSIQRLGEPLTSEILDMILDYDTGIGMDIVRVKVGDGGTWGDQVYDGPTQTIMPEQGVIVWEQPDWEDVKDDFDAYQIWLMQEAQARGVDTILASVWSPPAWMKQNNSVTSSGFFGPPNRIRTDMRQEFADYLAEYVLGYKEHFGIDITHVSPTNEPDFSGGYSSSLWSATELRDFVRDFLGPTFEARGVDAKIVLGEAIAFNESRALPALNDPAAEQYVDVVAAHAYSGLQQGATTPNPNAFNTSNALGKTIWQTEYMNNGAPQDRVFINTTISDGLRYATLVGNMFDVTGISGYFWWWPASNSGADGSNLIRLMNDGSPQGNNPTETGEYRVFKRYYTIGQYSRFLTSDYYMIDADKNPASNVIVTAYKDPGTNNYTIVAVNRNNDDIEIGFELDGFPLAPESKDDCKDDGWRDFDHLGFLNQGLCVAAMETGAVAPPSVVPYRTSPNENMRKHDPIAVTDGSFSMELRGRSVTTFVPAEFALPELPDKKDVFSEYFAEENDGQSEGLDTRDGGSRGTVVTNVSDGDYIRYANVNFADGSAAGFLNQKGELRMHAEVAGLAGGTIEVRLGDPETGNVVGTMVVPEGTDPDAWSTVTTDIDTSTDGAREFHDMYLVFTGSGSDLFDIDLFRFSD